MTPARAHRKGPLVPVGVLREAVWEGGEEAPGGRPAREAVSGCRASWVELGSSSPGLSLTGVEEERTNEKRTVAFCNNGKMTILTSLNPRYLFSLSEKLQCKPK